ncbi:OpgC domain-containing protein [Jiella sp. MQZ9-1]|uniref:OpgC domain-containing protein n=1 Tax=Jiella flava TaxID=2816857 RepID=A0A939FYN2_9HYPH|nr:OpgC domain-containing protein [Jiella flava]MBO0661769.1 OpgC domain-containing protein [Jiella flava]MCD2470410.1 OpgC domain-containing protein [Jiella flava]
MNIAALPRPTQGRDHRVDFWRGIALVMIFINHIPGNLYENFTSRNFGFSDAAELFVFLAGFASAYAYGRLFLGGHRLVATLKAWRRAGVLFLVQAMLTLFAIGISCWGALVLGQGELLTRIGLASFNSAPIETMVGFATLGHQLGYVNILPMYAAMLFMLPALLFLARIDLRLMLGGSIAVWLLAGIFSIDMPNYPLPGGWFFNPFSWQLIFAFGLFCGFRRIERGYSVAFKPWLMALAGVYAMIAFLTVRFQLWSWWGALPFPTLLTGFDKTYVSLPRLLHVLAVVYIFANAAAASPLASIRRENPFAMLGRHSLPVFATGTVLSLFAQVFKFDAQPHFLFDTLIIAAGITLQFTLARYLDWWGVAQKVALGAKAERPIDPTRAAVPAESRPMAARAGIYGSQVSPNKILAR